MPDHPSWPAELVEKGEAAARESLMEATDIIRPGDEPYVGWSQVLAERVTAAVLSALSGDLVPREQADALREDLEEVTLIALNAQRDTFRSQADALAEALEAMWTAGSWELADAPCGFTEQGDDPCPADDPECEECEQRAALKKMESALASYRKTTSGASGETE